MKVLWVTNTIFPDLSELIGQSVPALGGWMYGLARGLVENGTDLIVATARPNIDSIQTKISGIEYYLLKGKKIATEYDPSLEPQWQTIIKETRPDIVHIHGTEFAHGLSLVKACPKLDYVISIQGLVTICAKYFTGNIPLNTIRKYSTLRDCLKKDGILQSQKKFYYRGQSVEKKYFELCRNFIGRTQWDFDHTLTLNKTAQYHFCNESLRNAFYSSKKWNKARKKDYTIFLSQANYPLKGLHQVIKAISLIKDDFPDIRIRVAGGSIIKNGSFRDKIALGGYGRYILSLIRKFELQKHIEFPGMLTEEEMVQEYLNCHVFICPSSIENSPNSLGEAQMLGVPCIASYVGGIPDMVRHGESGILYRFEEVEMLAQAIKTIFTDDSLAEKLSLGGIQDASKRHNREINLKKTLDIYRAVLSA